jgi:hypothetical protein
LHRLPRAAKATVHRILAEQPLHPERVKHYLEQRDPEFETKLREVPLVYQHVALQNQNGGGMIPVIITVSVDAKPGLQAVATPRICRRRPASIPASAATTSTNAWARDRPGRASAS